MSCVSRRKGSGEERGLLELITTSDFGRKVKVTPDMLAYSCLSGLLAAVTDIRKGTFHVQAQESIASLAARLDVLGVRKDVTRLVVHTYAPDENIVLDAEKAACIGELVRKYFPQLGTVALRSSTHAAPVFLGWNGKELEELFCRLKVSHIDLDAGMASKTTLTQALLTHCRGLACLSTSSCKHAERGLDIHAKRFQASSQLKSSESWVRMLELATKANFLRPGATLLLQGPCAIGIDQAKSVAESIKRAVPNKVTLSVEQFIFLEGLQKGFLDRVDTVELVGRVYDEHIPAICRIKDTEHLECELFTVRGSELVIHKLDDAWSTWVADYFRAPLFADVKHIQCPEHLGYAILPLLEQAESVNGLKVGGEVAELTAGLEIAHEVLESWKALLAVTHMTVTNPKVTPIILQDVLEALPKLETLEVPAEVDSQMLWDGNLPIKHLVLTGSYQGPRGILLPGSQHRLVTLDLFPLWVSEKREESFFEALQALLAAATLEEISLPNCPITPTALATLSSRVHHVILQDIGYPAKELAETLGNVTLLELSYDQANASELTSRTDRFCDLLPHLGNLETLAINLNLPLPQALIAHTISRLVLATPTQHLLFELPESFPLEELSPAQAIWDTRNTSASEASTSNEVRDGIRAVEWKQG